MKVVQQNFTILTLQERPIGIWMFSGLTAILGLFIFISYSPPVDLFGFFCITCSNLMMFGSPVKTCQFDKRRNIVTLKKKGWLGTYITSCPMDKIAKVQVEPLNLAGIRFYKLSLWLFSGERFYLTPTPSTDARLLQKLAGHIKKFLS